MKREKQLMVMKNDFFLGKKIVRGIAIAILGDDIFIITPPRKYTSQKSNLYSHLCGRLSCLRLVQQLVGEK